MQNIEAALGRKKKVGEQQRECSYTLVGGDDRGGARTNSGAEPIDVVDSYRSSRYTHQCLPILNL